MKGFIVYPTYRTEENCTYIYLFGRLENGESFLTINKYRPYFYIREKDEKKAKQLAQADFEATTYKTFSGEKVIRVLFNNTKELTETRRIFNDNDITCYEADIRLVYRFMIDMGIKGSMEISGEYQREKDIDRVYREPQLKPAQFVPKLKIFSIDIETDCVKHEEIYAISLIGDGLKKTLLVYDKPVKNAVIFKSEKDMLEAFAEIIRKFDPDIITGWNVIDFDLKKIEDRFKKYKIPFRLGRYDEKCKISIEDNFIMDSKADFPGRMVLDAIHMLRYSFIRLEDYKLDTAARVLIGEGKIHVTEENKGAMIDDYYKNDPEKLVEYNMNDAELVLKILEAKKIIELTIERSLLTGMQLDRVKATIASLDSLYLRKARQRGFVCPSVYNFEKTDQAVGGFVMTSKPGIFDQVIVLDFKSMYPSIIQTFNIDPFTLSENGEIVAPNGARFLRERGILPEIISELWEAREQAKKRKDAIASQAIKTTMNGFYGALGNPTCRYHNLMLSNAITGFGQHFINMTANLLREKGYTVIYGDTDSIFVDLDVKTPEEAEKIGFELQDWINNYYKEYIKKKYKTDSKLFIEFDKVYKVFMMPQIRGAEKGAKKRYAGLLWENGKEELDIVGLEYVRTDWTMMARQFQYQLLDLIFHKKEYEIFIRKFVEEMKNGNYDDLLVYKKSITKPLNEYIKTTPPHVKAARKKKNLTSNIISYVMTVDGPEPADDVKHKIDYQHYLDKQIRPIADSILQFFNKNLDDVLKRGKQSTLGSF